MCTCKTKNYLRMTGRYLRMAERSLWKRLATVRCKEASMATTLKFLPRSTIRWRATQFIVVDYADIDAILPGAGQT
jgi:hypothetical protein